MKRTVCLFTLFVVIILSIVSCGPSQPENTTPAPTETPPTTTPMAIPNFNNDTEALVFGNTAFALDLYQKLRDADGNLFYSPYSISTALAMTYAGARGTTEQQMADTLHFILPGERLHASFQELAEALDERGKDVEILVEDAEGEWTKDRVDGFRLNIVNSLWGQEGYKFLPEYLQLVEKYYGGALETLDFMNEPEPSRLEINKWASEQTEGKITDILPPGVIDWYTRLVLANAIYFNANWEHKFSEALTSDETFNLLDGSQVTVPLMRQEEEFRYAEDDTYQAVGLPYMGGELEMVVLLPREGEFAEFEASLDAAMLKDIIGKMEEEHVEVFLPKFEFESSYRLDETLAEMGMPDAFLDDKADFTGMTEKRELYIGAALHKAFVSVDEEGTEAAAVTAIVMVLAAAPPEPVVFRADHPFIFLIRDIETGTILFIGRVLNPAA